MKPTTNHSSNPIDSQLKIILSQADSATSVAQLREMLLEVGKKADEANSRNRTLADAVVNSAKMIDELQQTRQKLAEAQVQTEQSEKNTRLLSETIFERSQDAMMVLKADFCAISANQKAFTLLDLGDDRFSFDHDALEFLASCFSDLECSAWSEGVKFELTADGLSERELFRVAGNEKFWVEFSFSAFLLKNENHYLVIGRDITPRKQYERELSRSRDFLNKTIDAIPDMLYVKSPDLSSVLVNDSFRDAALTNPEVFDNDAAREKERQLLESGSRSDDEETHVSSEGEMKTLSIRRSVFQDPVTGESYLVAAARDITGQRQIEERNRLLASVFKNAQEGVLILDLDGRICEANPKFCGFSGMSEAELLHQKLAHLISWHQSDFAKIIELARNGSPSLGRVKLNVDDVDSESTIYWCSISDSQNEAGEVTHLVAMFSDISQIEETQRRLHRQALHDNLTGLPNRRFFSQQIEQLIASPTTSRFGVCFLDLDDFKIVNDTLGHEAGDQLLIQVSDRIKSAIYRDCFLARFGGDEFALLVPEVDDPFRVAKIADKVVNLLNEPFTLGENQVFVGVSIGMTRCPDDSTDVDGLLRNADVAMYHAKDEGKNTVRGFTRDLAVRIEKRQTLLNELRKAVSNGDLELAYQPKWNLKTDRLSGCEALIRWNNEGKAVNPADLIDVAEKSGLILPLGDKIIEMAMNQAREWREAGLFDGAIAINLSPRQLNDPDFVERFNGLLLATESQPEWFELEITENAMMENLESSIILINELRELGVPVAIDDFGTGYSSLNYLKTFPVSTLKIDISFVRDLPNDARAVAIAKTVLSLGHGLGMTVVAEGVETQEQRDFLKAQGCDIIQGYLINQPLPASEFGTWASQLDQH